MSRFDGLQRKLDECAELLDIVSLYNAYLPGFYKPSASGNSTENDPFYCSGAVQFVISYMVDNATAKNKLIDLTNHQDAANSILLGPGSANALAQRTATLNGASAFIGLFNTRNTNEVGHTFCILIDRSTSSTHQWCLYQANYTGSKAFPNFTLSHSVNTRKKFGGGRMRNRPMQPIATLAAFFAGLTRSSDRPPELDGCTTTEWNYIVADFNANVVIGA